MSIKKLGVAYNVWDGLELLEGSIRSIREQVDFVCVVHQEKSNFGDSLDESQLQYFNKLKESGLVDEFIEYIPVFGTASLNGHTNEINKRNVGLRSCLKNSCTHFVSMDTDEYYDALQLEYAKNNIGDHTSSACQMVTYWREDYILDPVEEYYVPLIQKIDDRRFILNQPWDISADPTRKLFCKDVKVFTRDEIEMHHYSYVRDNIEKKWKNSSARSYQNYIDKMVNEYNNWKPGDQAYLSYIRGYVDVKKVTPRFKIYF